MKTVHKSVLIWYTPEQMFALVTDVAKYPEFLPWCSHTRVLESSDAGMTAEVGMALGRLRHSFTTRNTHEDNRRVSMRLLKGPFSKLQGDWTFAPVKDGERSGCKVDLKLQYGFDSLPLAMLIGPIFDRIAASMVDAFVKRAQQIYGHSPAY